jgi:hypothetical protein
VSGWQAAGGADCAPARRARQAAALCRLAGASLPVNDAAVQLAAALARRRAILKSACGRAALELPPLNGGDSDGQAQAGGRLPLRVGRSGSAFKLWAFQARDPPAGWAGNRDHGRGP